MYNFYTFAGKTRLLSICQVLLAVPLPVTFSFVVEALSIFVGASTRGLLLSLGARLSGSLALGLSLLLETGGLANRQRIVKFSLHGQLRILQHCKQFINCLIHAVHPIVLNKSFKARRERHEDDICSQSFRDLKSQLGHPLPKAHDFITCSLTGAPSFILKFHKA